MKIKVGYGATYGRLLRLSAAVFAVIALTSCKEIPNSVHTEKELASNTLYTPFSGRSPKHLDPTSSYSSDETPYTYSIYEPLYQYHFLERPYRLILVPQQRSLNPFIWIKTERPYLRLLRRKKSL